MIGRGPAHRAKRHRLSTHARVQRDLVCGSVALFLIAHAPQAFAARLGGAYYVDDAEIGKVGSCEIESWASFAANSDRIGVFSPACVIDLGRPVEVGTNIVGTRSAGDAGGTGSLTGKTVLLPLSQKSVGLAVAGAVVYDPINHIASGAILNVPISVDLSKALRVNVNVGAQYNSGPHSWFATGGAGVSWNFVKHWSVISEVFAIVGPGQTNPRFQSGIRYSPNKDVDCDLIYGRNLTGEGANWITLALTVRIGDN
jgi:hypothetical protein